ncbi:hypothetical protein SCACP_36810 [Sporomusa carbonis]|uniref:hypothetical protein n=1 Tax=Sporomusa carbonis TaxID=3076075 RepID=UPI003A6AC2C6
MQDAFNADTAHEEIAKNGPVTQPGDIWLLGSHRLMCGDSKNYDSFLRLFAGKRA